MVKILQKCSVFNLKMKRNKKTNMANKLGFETRSIAIMVMRHEHGKGLILHPRVANTQVVIIPFPFKEIIRILAGNIIIGN